MTPFLKFEGVWKRFRRGHKHDSLRDLLPAIAKRIVGHQVPQRTNARDFWAVRDLSFEVRPGDVLGIIGGNGAGKSTTLKLLNHIMEPTLGDVSTSGRIGALIEVSAGFHHDLTGRQNVFLQGAIMGMRKAEVRKKFDQIVDFAGVSEFMDTPLKRYSSGMAARLGFAVAAHLEPDILIIDEVLAVGDAAFQAKAFGRIKEMARAGAPVILVSHQLERVVELCSKAILLEKGEVRTSGTPLHCVNEYLHGLAGDSHDAAGIAGVEFAPTVAPNGLTVQSGQEFSVVVKGTSTLKEARDGWVPALRVVDPRTNTDIHSVTGLQRNIPLPLCGEFEYHITLQMNVPPGAYQVQPFIWDAVANRRVISGPRLRIEVLDRMPFYGEVQMNSRWRIAKAGTGAPILVEDVDRQTA